MAKFYKKFSGNDKDILIEWAEKNAVNDDSYISYEFTNEENNEDYISIPVIDYFLFKHQWFLIADGLLKQGFIIDFNPKHCHFLAIKNRVLQ